MTQTSVEPSQTEPFVLYQSTLLSTYAEQVIHGFTGKPLRLGGPSYMPEAIQQERLTLCQAKEMNFSRLVAPRQTHTDQFRMNDVPCERETDAVILTENDIPAMVQVADCVPIILYEPQQHVGAVVHAGWRGTAQSILLKVTQNLIQDYGANPEALIAAIGPSIGGCCYEVSDAVAESVGQSIPEYAAELYQMIQPNGKPRIDLKQVNRLQLLSLGVKQVEIINVCTRCMDDHFWSFRRGETGRQAAFLQLKPKREPVNR